MPRRLRHSTFALALACGLAILLPSAGCAAMKATEQPGKKDFNVLMPGTQRTHVIAELGAPSWSDELDGATTDVFALKQGYTKTTKAGRALLHGAADVATMGLWEVVGIPVETLADGTDVQVSITYDRDQCVDSVDVIKGEKVIKTVRPEKPAPLKQKRTAVRSADPDLTLEDPADFEAEPLE